MRAFSWSGGAHWAIGLTIALIFFNLIAFRGKERVCA